MKPKRLILDLETLTEHPTQIAAAKAAGVSQTMVGDHLRCKFPFRRFIYADEPDREQKRTAWLENGNKPPHAYRHQKHVIDIQEKVVYPSISEASRKTGVSYWKVYQSCSHVKILPENRRFEYGDSLDLIEGILEKRQEEIEKRDRETKERRERRKAEVKNQLKTKGGKDAYRIKVDGEPMDCIQDALDYLHMTHKELALKIAKDILVFNVGRHRVVIGDKGEGDHYDTRPVICLTTGENFASSKAAGEHYSINHTTIVNAIRKQAETAKGLKFMYLDDFKRQADGGSLSWWNI